MPIGPVGIVLAENEGTEGAEATVFSPSAPMVDYRKMNCALKENLSVEVLRRARELFPAGLVMSSSLGRYSAVMLHLATSLIPDIPVINLRLGEETLPTRRHREEMKKRLRLNLKVYDIREDKAGALRHALQDLDARALISGVLWEETENRAAFDYFMDDRTFGIRRIYPLLHWKEADLLHYTLRNKLPLNEDYTDSFKEESEKKECGIHLFRDGAGI